MKVVSFSFQQSENIMESGNSRMTRRCTVGSLAWEAGAKVITFVFATDTVANG